METKRYITVPLEEYNVQQKLVLEIRDELDKISNGEIRIVELTYSPGNNSRKVEYSGRDEAIHGLVKIIKDSMRDIEWERQRRSELHNEKMRAEYRLSILIDAIKDSFIGRLLFGKHLKECEVKSPRS